jgi:hypothetical protein
MGFSLRGMHGATATETASVRGPRGVIVEPKIRIAAKESKREDRGVKAQRKCGRGKAPEGAIRRDSGPSFLQVKGIFQLSEVTIGKSAQVAG